jgi:transposase-like protein
MRKLQAKTFVNCDWSQAIRMVTRFEPPQRLCRPLNPRIHLVACCLVMMRMKVQLQSWMNCEKSLLPGNRYHVEPISKLAEELGVQPSLIHNWVNQVLAQAEKAFEKTPENGRDEKLKDRRIEHLEAKLVNKNEVIAELMEANVLAKKETGEL